MHLADATCPTDPSGIKELPLPAADGSQVSSSLGIGLSYLEGSYLARGYTPPWGQPASKKAQILCLNLEQLCRIS